MARTCASVPPRAEAFQKEHSRPHTDREPHERGDQAILDCFDLACSGGWQSLTHNRRRNPGVGRAKFSLLRPGISIYRPWVSLMVLPRRWDGWGRNEVQMSGLVVRWGVVLIGALTLLTTQALAQGETTSAIVGQVSDAAACLYSSETVTSGLARINILCSRGKRRQRLNGEISSLFHV